MAFIGNKEIEKIENDLKEIIKLKLLDGFQNRKLQTVVKVDNIVLDYKIDEEKSNRDIILITTTKALARVWVNLKTNAGQTNDQIQLQINSIQFLFNNETSEYEILNNDKIILIDISY